MRVGLTTNAMACQPLRNFGKVSHSNKKTPSMTTNFSAGTVSREEYDKLNAKYDLLARIAVVQADQYKALVAKYNANNK